MPAPVILRFPLVVLGATTLLMSQGYLVDEHNTVIALAGPLLRTGDSIGDGGPATQAFLNWPAGVAVDSRGNLYIAERAGHRIRRVDLSTGVITTYAGTGSRGFSGDAGPAIQAQIDSPDQIAADANGNLYITDRANSRIRRVDARTGIITTVAGNGRNGFDGDGGPAVEATLDAPFGLAVGPKGNLYIADTENHRIRRVDSTTGIITTVAGNGEWGFRGDDGPATQASLARPHVIVIDRDGHLIIADTMNQRIRRVDLATGIITTIAGTGKRGFGGDGGPATQAKFTYFGGLAVDAFGNFLVTGVGTHRMRRIDAKTGIIKTLAGTGKAEFRGDGGPAVNASLHLPYGIAVDNEGNIFIADSWNGRVRRIAAHTGIITTVAGSRIPPPTDIPHFH